MPLLLNLLPARFLLTLREWFDYKISHCVLLSYCHTFDFQVSIVTLPNLESEYRVKKGKNTTIFFIMHDENDGEDVADDDDDDNY